MKIVDLAMVQSSSSRIDRSLTESLFLGRASINRTPDALSSMDYMDDPLLSNQAGNSIVLRIESQIGLMKDGVDVFVFHQL